MHTRLTAFAAVAAFAVGVTGVAVVAARSGGDDRLERLPSLSAGFSAGESVGVELVVEGTLPKLPDKAPAYRLGSEARPDTASLSASASAAVVGVEPCPQCAASPMPVAGVPRAEAERVARRAFEEAGVDADGLELRQDQARWHATVRPVVEGLPTLGFETVVFIGPQGEVTGPLGHLDEPKLIGDYPLAGVDAGLDRLRRSAGAAAGQGRVVTLVGVHLALQRVGDVLVPVYVFEGSDSARLPVAAVADEWLEGETQPPPEPHVVDGASSGACSASVSGSSVQSSEDNQPLTVEVCVDPPRAKVGQEVVFRVTAVDPDAEVLAHGCGTTTRFGDEEGAVMAGCTPMCLAPGRFAPKPKPRPGKVSTTYAHRYSKPGTYTAVFEFASELCSPYGSRGEGRIEVLVVE